MREQAPKGVLPERLHLGRLAPVLQVAAVGGVAPMQGHGDAGLVDPGPEGVVDGIGGRSTPGRRDHGPDAGEHDAHVAGQRPLELGHRVVHVHQGDEGGGEDALAVGEPPVLVDPAVEGPEGGHEGRGIADQGLLHPDGQGREEERALQVLVVHHGQSGVAVAVGRADGVELAEQVADAGVARVAAPEVLVEGTRLGHRVERRVGDEPVDPAAHQQALAAAHLGPLHGPIGELGLDVAGEGVERLVVVVVGVERLEVDGGHRPPPGQGRARPSGPTPTAAWIRS